MHLAGGGGIHRTLNQPPKPKKQPGDLYKAKVRKNSFTFEKFLSIRFYFLNSVALVVIEKLPINMIHMLI